MPELTSPRMTETSSRSISLRVFCTPVPTSFAESSTRSWTWRPRMPPFLLISASAYLAPSTSLCASADSTPVSGLTMPILTGSSPSALMMKGAPMNWLAPSARPACTNVRRRSEVVNFDMHSSQILIRRFRRRLLSLSKFVGLGPRIGAAFRAGTSRGIAAPAATPRHALRYAFRQCGKPGSHTAQPRREYLLLRFWNGQEQLAGNFTRHTPPSACRGLPSRLGLFGEKPRQPAAHRVGLFGRPLTQALAGLHAEFAGSDLLAQKRMRPGRCIEIFVKHLGNIEREIDADQIGLLHRPEHCGTRTEAFAHHGVDGLGVADPGGDQRDRLAFHGVLQAIADEARHVAAHMDRNFAGVAQEIHGLAHRVCAGLFVLDDFDQRNQMRWIPEMGAENAFAMFEMPSDLG